MKKNGRKLDRANEARRKIESQALFLEMLKNPHLVVTPTKYKGSRQSNKNKAIRESRNDG
jgi:arsenate reductase-like glutaredoxin family protein